MKKIISLTLVLCMLLSAALAIGVSAKYTAPETVDHTSDLWDFTSPTGLDAFYGSVEIGTEAYNAADWENAYPYKNGINPREEYNLLWDENGLYLLVEHTVTGGSIATNSKKTQLYVSLPTSLTAQTDITGGRFYITTTLADSDLTADPKPRKADTVTYQKFECSDVATGEAAAPASVISYSEVVEGGFVTEFFVPWTVLQDGMNDTFVDTSKSAADIKASLENQVIGIMIRNDNFHQRYPNGDNASFLSYWHTVQNYSGTSTVPRIHDNYVGYDPITLLPAGSSKSIIPDTDYWKTAFASSAHDSTAVYEIDSEAKLLGLAWYLNDVKEAIIRGYTKGKTFKLTKDMVLNAHVTDWSTVTESEIRNPWPMIPTFYGILDGNGYSIKGVYCNAYPAKPDEAGSLTASGGYLNTAGNTLNFGMICALKGGGIKNLTLDNVYVSRKQGAKTDDRTGGILVGIVDLHTGHGTTAIFENIRIGKNATIEGAKAGNYAGNAKKASQGIGGFVGEFGQKDGVTYTLHNLIFEGTLKPSVSNSKLGGISCWVKSNATTVYDIQNCWSVGCEPFGTLTGGGETTDFTAERNTYKNSGTVTDVETALASGAWIETEKGAMPLAMADEFAEYGIQATEADGGKYNIRVVGEIAHKNYKSVDFVITLTTAEGSATWGYGCKDKNDVEYQLSKTCYTSMLANGEEFTADTFNKDFIEGTDTALYALTFNGLDVSVAYTLSVKTVWTLTDGTVVEGTAAHTVVPTPHVAQ